jgi:hypothetical protein
MTIPLKWVCASTAILVGTSTVGAGSTPGATKPGQPGGIASSAPADVAGTGAAIGDLPACAFAAVLGCF